MTPEGRIRCTPAPLVDDPASLASLAPPGRHALLFTSAPGSGGASFNRYTVAAIAPVLVLEPDAAGKGLRVGPPVGGGCCFSNPSEAIGNALNALAACPTAELPFSDAHLPFTGGLAGYAGYEAFRAEGRRACRPAKGREVGGGGLPGLWFGLYPAVWVADHLRGRAWWIVRPTGDESADASRRSEETLREWIGRGVPGDGVVRGVTRGSEVTGDWRERGWELSLDRGAHAEAVARIQEYLRAGDAYQVNLTVRHRRAFPQERHPDLFGEIHRSNPAAYGAWIDGGGWALISNSPELLLDLRPDGRIQTDPIKGTIARAGNGTRDTAADESGRAALLASAKDRAEHLMIVDLERNDLGRVCRPGSVRVDPFMRIETLPGLFHMVSSVRGRVRPGVGIGEVLAAVMPGGSVTGAPKLRACEIIDELEPCGRGPYTGGVGWITPEGTARMNVAIRTLALAGGYADLHTGGAIVADSAAGTEWEECRAKGEALARAVWKLV